MATSKEYRDFCIEQLSLLDNITCKPMMGEYLLYYKDTLFGGIYDERLLVKKTNSNEKYQLKEALPYQNAKLMYLIEELEEKETIKKIILDTCKDLPIRKKRKKENG